MMLMLGDYRFNIDTSTYQTNNRSTSYRWGKQDLLSSEPALQFIGKGDDTINLGGVIYPEHKGGFQQVEKMREEAGKGKALLLMEGSGKVLGHWAIESITENQSIFKKDGSPKRIEFSLSLRKSKSPNKTKSPRDFETDAQGPVGVLA